MGETVKRTAGDSAAPHPERELDYYEVDLRDYLRILWQGKWIVLATFLVSVGIAAFLSYRAPDVYRATAELVVEKPQGLPFAYSPPSGKEVEAWSRDRDLLTEVASASGLTADWIGAHLKASSKGNFVDLSLEGAAPPDTLEGALRALISSLEARGRDHLVGVAQGALGSLAAQREELSRKLSAWEEAASLSRDAAQAQKRKIEQEIRELTTGSAEVALGEALTLRGYDLQKRLDVLYARLQSVELFLDSLERLGPAALPGVGGNYATTRASLLALDAREGNIEKLVGSSPSPIALVRAPLSSRVGPNRRMNIAVAGVLGLFLGILLVFFVHYLKGEKEKG